MQLTSEILHYNGWYQASQIWWLDTFINASKCRIGWNPADGKVYVNYGHMPLPITQVEEMNAFLKICGISEIVVPT